MDIPQENIDGKYLPIQQLGSGSSGVVYKARQLSTNQYVALKTFRTDRKDPTAKARFMREAAILKTLNHSHILHLIDMGIAPDGTLYFASPYVQGMTLKHFFANSRLEYETSISIAQQLLVGLEAAHKRKIIHRDLKPSNIFLVTENGSSKHHVQLLDFGISKALNDQETCLTTTGLAIGTTQYMAPEQAMGSRDVDERVDIYSVGLIFYQLFTGKKPFNNMEMRTFNPFVPHSFIRPSRIASDLPLSIENVILKALKRKPSSRYANAMKMKEALNVAINAIDNVDLFELSNKKTETAIPRC